MLAGMAIYQSTALQFFYVLYKRHRLAFKTHYKRLLGMFFVLEITLATIVWYQGSGFVNSICNIAINTILPVSDFD